MEKMPAQLRIRKASENNLKDLDLDIPFGQLIVVTGVSGSGKSSLAFDVIAKEGQRRYLETYPSFSKQFMGKLSRSKVERIEGLSPVITIGQKTSGAGARSTVGTLSDLYDFLRLIFARWGKGDPAVKASRSLFSFNSPIGACPQCKGLGLEEKISVDKLVVDPALSLRNGVLAPTLPNGYIMYSQVTLEVLNKVCQAHDFDIDIPWKQLSDNQKDVILNGSECLKIPFGKHSLESRLKWTGITPKPREEGFYKGLLPIMSDILRRDRNKNILKYVESVRCSSCNGKRLKSHALSVLWNRKNIAELTGMELSDLMDWLKSLPVNSAEKGIAPVLNQLTEKLKLLKGLGVGYLQMDRPASTLSGGEAQRIRLVNQVLAELSHVLYVFDEPSIGLHPRDNHEMRRMLRKLVEQGNTVMVVEHDEATIREADWIIDIGPAAGANGGSLLFNGPLEEFLQQKNASKSPTLQSLKEPFRKNPNPSSKSEKSDFYLLAHANANNLQNISCHFLKGGFNVVTGVSGSGRASLVHRELKPSVQAGLKTKESAFGSIIAIDQKPIGRTPRSNPATYTGMADKLRDLFAKQTVAKERGFGKSRFSFNTKGGRCDRCEGAGREQIGLHFLGKVDLICPKCNGKRFNPETLAITFQGKNISEVLEMTVLQALNFFSGQAAIQKQLETLVSVGLGYLSLGQSSSTLSGGEAQRLKLATELQKPEQGKTLYLLDEPTISLHTSDVAILLRALRQLMAKGNTIVCIENDAQVILQSDWMIDLGPGSGRNGGKLIEEGRPEVVLTNPNSVTGQYLNGALKAVSRKSKTELPAVIGLKGISTHLLKHIDVEIPREKLTVLTGVSGSGKTSLAFHTLLAEAQSRFSESWSTYARSHLKLSKSARVEQTYGLGPAVAIGRKYLGLSPRSTVGTLTGWYELYRLLFSRVSQAQGHDFTARHYSFNHQLGACPECDGLGARLTCDPAKLVVKPELGILEGALLGHAAGNYYGDPNGQHLAILKTVAKAMNLDITLAWKDLDEESRQLALYGTGDRIWKVQWAFKNKSRSGVQELEAPWLGFCHYIDQEFERKQHNKNTAALEALLHAVPCGLCQGDRLKKALLEVKFSNKNIAELSRLTVEETVHFMTRVRPSSDWEKALWDEIAPRLNKTLIALSNLGLNYLSAERPAHSLSGGEGQRIRLAGQLYHQLFGVTYVLDEPTIGLHSKDTARLVKVLHELIAMGNTVLVVEHDRTIIKVADHIIEMGPGAGKNGGEVLYSGKLEGLKMLDSPTANMLKQNQRIRPIDRSVEEKGFGLKAASKHNLQNIDLSLSAGSIIAITGVSGSGKSTLINKVLLASHQAGSSVGCEAVFGLERFDKVLAVDQRPLSTNVASTTATLSGLMELIIRLFAASDEAKANKLKKGVFSHQHKEGKCPECNGWGQQKVALDFMGDLWIACESCKGSRYKTESFLAKVQEMTIAEVLKLSVQEAADFFKGEKGILAILEALVMVGLGHLAIGQPGNSLSGGEAQRLKLAREWIDRSGKNLYLLDEPSTGLHWADLQGLIQVFNQLADEGHTVLFIEHNSDLINMANQVVELGPAGGPAGGQLVSNIMQ